MNVTSPETRSEGPCMLLCPLFLKHAPSLTVSAGDGHPTAWDGINWYCYVVLGLIFITDFTPLGRQ